MSRSDAVNIAVRISLVAALVWAGSHLLGDGWWTLAGVGIEAIALLQFVLLAGVLWVGIHDFRHGKRA